MGSSHKPTLTHRIKRFSRKLGFDYCAITPIDEAPHAGFFEHWIASGRAGEMTYLERNSEKRRSPALLADKNSAPFRSIIVLGVNYFQRRLTPALRDDPSRGVIASYAWADDYHDIIRPYLYKIDRFIRTHTGRTSRGKCLVDTGPVLEREWAEQAGIGFTGKNCCTIHPRDGSWLFLATIMTPEILEYESAQSAEKAAPATSPMPTCGQCMRCLDACPTDAIVEPYDLDPRRCISYWTIEAKGPIPTELRAGFGNRIFGCDICQEVCPFNGQASRRQPERTPLMSELSAHNENVTLPLLEGFSPATPYWLDDDAFRDRFRRSPILRTKRRGMLRNVCVALGNWGSLSAEHALEQALTDTEPLVRGHAAWGLGRVATQNADKQYAQALEKAAVQEMDDWVRSEISDALSSRRSNPVY